MSYGVHKVAPVHAWCNVRKIITFVTLQKKGKEKVKVKTTSLVHSSSQLTVEHVETMIESQTPGDNKRGGREQNVHDY